MAELKTRIVLRNDSTANWLNNLDQVLLKGEVGIEFLENGSVKMKIGDGAKTWEQLDYFGGETLVGDDSTIVVDGQTISLAGFKDAEAGAQLVKSSDGKLTWVKPSTETVDGLKTIVETLQGDVTVINSVLFPTEDGAQTLLSRVEALEGVDVDKKITDGINAFVEKVSDDGVVNTLKELVDYVAEHGTETSGMLADIAELKGLVGTTSVADQIEAASDSLLAIIGNSIPKSSEDENKISITEDGTMEVNSLNVNKLTQTEGDSLILNGGSSAV